MNKNRMFPAGPAKDKVASKVAKSGKPFTGGKGKNAGLSGKCSAPKSGKP